MHCGERAALLLREWPHHKRRQLLSSLELNAPTECCLVEVRGSGRAPGLELVHFACPGLQLGVAAARLTEHELQRPD